VVEQGKPLGGAYCNTLLFAHLLVCQKLNHVIVILLSYIYIYIHLYSPTQMVAITPYANEERKRNYVCFNVLHTLVLRKEKNVLSRTV